MITTLRLNYLCIDDLDRGHRMTGRAIIFWF